MTERRLRVDLHPEHPNMLWASGQVAELMFRNAECVVADRDHDDGAPLETQAILDHMNVLVGAVLAPLLRLADQAELDRSRSPSGWASLVASIEQEQANSVAALIDALRHLAIGAVQLLVKDGFDVDELTLMRRIVHARWPWLPIEDEE